MMVCLRGNVLGYLCDVGLGHRENTVAATPTKLAMQQLIFVNPVRRSPFEQFEDILNRVSRWQVNQGMHMLWVHIVDL